MLEVFQLNGVPCTMEQVEEVAHRPETRTGLLDFVGSDCHGRPVLQYFVTNQCLNVADKNLIILKEMTTLIDTVKTLSLFGSRIV